MPNTAYDGRAKRKKESNVRLAFEAPKDVERLRATLLRVVMEKLRSSSSYSEDDWEQRERP